MSTFLNFLLVPGLISLCRPAIAVIAAPKIAIIGAGPGGSSAAYYLSQLLNNNVDIDVFDERPVIGGRTATVNIFGNEYETGGSVIHPRNKLAVDLAKEFGLAHLKDSSSDVTSIYKNSEYVFSTSSWKLVTIWKVLHRYGFDFNKLESMASDFIGKFENIYKLQDEGRAFDNVEHMLSSMGPELLNLTISHFHKYLTEHGYAERFITELVQAITYVNYGQETNIHSLVGLISVAGAGDGLWSVQNGNKLLPAALLNNSNAKVHLKTRIESVVALPSGSSYKLATDRNGQNLIGGTYDLVILAFPWSIQNGIQFTNFLDKEAEIEEATLPFRNRKYHRTVATIVAASGISSKYRKWMNILCSTPNFFTSISRIHPARLTRSERVPVYKIFSPEPLTDRQLHEIFEEIHLVEVVDWLAYPEYDTVPPPLPIFNILPNIYYLNAIEWAASAIEMSLISGRNAAIQIASRVSGKRFQNEEPPKKKRKTEL